MAGIYIHIPFCKQACHYCDFHFSTNTQLKSKMTDMICHELVLQKNYLGKDCSVETVYFGGGTPSLLSPQELSKILDTIHLHFRLDIKELTLEANPDDLHPEKLKALKSLGFDRLSIGVQSFSDQVLKFYNRTHQADEALQCIDRARQTGFDKLSIDLMYGFPQVDHALWENDLKQALSLDPGHISSYCLTIEPDTALGRWASKGIFTPSSEDFNAEQFEIMQQHLGEAGYIQYEVSNFGKPEAFALHNSNYWKGEPYLGVGPSAHSFDGKNRQHNPSNNIKYIRSLEKNELIFEMDELTETDRLNEYLLTSLRTIWGTDLNKVQDNFNIDLIQTKAKEINLFKSESLLEISSNKMVLTPKGWLMADYIAGKLFL